MNIDNNIKNMDFLIEEIKDIVYPLIKKLKILQKERANLIKTKKKIKESDIQLKNKKNKKSIVRPSYPDDNPDDHQQITESKNILSFIKNMVSDGEDDIIDTPSVLDAQPQTEAQKNFLDKLMNTDYASLIEKSKQHH